VPATQDEKRCPSVPVSETARPIKRPRSAEAKEVKLQALLHNISPRGGGHQMSQSGESAATADCKLPFPLLVVVLPRPTSQQETGKQGNKIKGPRPPARLRDMVKRRDASSA